MDGRGAARRETASRRQIIDDADLARLALARLEQAAGAGRLDRATVAALVVRMESGGHSLMELLRRLARDLDVEDDSPESPHLRVAGEHARQLAASLRRLGIVIERGAAHR